MAKCFIMYNAPFMHAKPVQALYSSKLIQKVKADGSIFAVNMDTGAMTIISEARLTAAGYFLDKDGNLQSAVVNTKP